MRSKPHLDLDQHRDELIAFLRAVVPLIQQVALSVYPNR